MKQIEINYLTSTGYESLYPQVNCASITDFVENLYSKSEVDEMIQGLRNQTGDLKFAMGQYIGNGGDSPIQVILEFTPVFVVLSQNDGRWPNIGYTGTNAPDTIYLGFGNKLTLEDSTAFEIISNGFYATNASGTRSSLSLNGQGAVWNYLAFG